MVSCNAMFIQIHVAYCCILLGSTKKSMADIVKHMVSIGLKKVLNFTWNPVSHLSPGTGFWPLTTTC